MRRLINIIWVEKKEVLLSVLFGVIGGITSVALFAMSGFMIAKAALQPPFYIITMMTALLKLFGASKAGSRYAERYVSHRVTFNILSHLRVSFYEKLEPMAPRILNTYRSGDLLARIVGDIETLQHFYLRVFYPPLVMIIVFLATIFFTTFYSVWIAIVLLVGLLITGFVIPGLIGLKQWKVKGELREKRANLSSEVTELLYGFRDLKIHQKLENKEMQLLELASSYVQEQKREGMQAALSQSLNAAAGLCIAFVVLTLGTYFVTIGELNGLFLAMLVLISLTVFDNSVQMANFPAHLVDSKQAINRLSTVLNEEIPVPKTGVIEKQGASSIELREVTFTYPGESRPALKDVSFHLPPGSKTAIVGASGSGKSTVLQLVLDMYFVDKGEIAFNDQSLEDISSESIWEKTNVVLQANHFFYGTIRENLGIAKGNITDDEMTKVLAQMELPFSLDDTILEKGENLSGGEKQRLALARCFLKNAHIWLLDEPFSAVDVITEKSIFDKLLLKVKEDTVLLISHRLTKLEKMDQIIVMDHGTIVEKGSYNELIAKKGYFYELKKIEQTGIFNSLM